MAAPRVLAVLVASDGAAWLPEVLDALDQQTYANLDTVAVDNGGADGTYRALRRYLDDDHVLVSDVDVGFPAAIGMALDAGVAAASEADLLLFVHDDLVLAPDAVAKLVSHVSDDASLGVVGPKLVDYANPRLLQHVGASIDLTGRTDTGIEPDEVDQGQRDHTRPVLYVSTAGMLVRRELFDDLGRFDPRYHAFREDLDLCWRMWLADHGVEVAPDARARHVQAASNFQRLGSTASPGPRYYAERNTLATLLKCYTRARLATVLPLFLLVGVAKVIGFLVTRRFGDAAQTVRAWGWNLTHLRQTMRLRRSVQARRRRSDADLTDLFARIIPRARAYGEAAADWLAGGPGDVPTPTEADTDRRAEVGPAPVRAVTRHPVATVAGILGVLILIGGARLLGVGALRGGDFAAWPDSPLRFLSSYASAWNDAGGLGSSLPASPAQAVLGILHVMTFGNEWLASRVLLLGSLPLAWLAALRAGVILTPARLPRLAGATAYALSPPALAALTVGNLGALIVTALLPVLVLAASRLGRTDTPPTQAWRATFVAALVAAVLIAFQPPVGLVIAMAAGVGLLMIGFAPRPARRRRAVGIRIVTATGGAATLLLPWSLTFIGPDSPLLAGLSTDVDRATTAGTTFLDWLTLSPDLAGFSGGLAGVGYLVAGLLGLLIAYRRRPGLVGGMSTAVVLAVVGAVALARPDVDVAAWPGLALLVAAAGYAGLLVLALAAAGGFLGEHGFGWRQITTVAGLGTVAVSVTAGGVWLALSGFDVYSVGEPVLPAFVTAEQEVDGPYRVLVLSADDGVVTWDVAGRRGPTMAAFGAPPPEDFDGIIGEAVTDIVDGRSPAAAARLGLANVLYVYVPEGGRDEVLETALGDQLDLEPQSVEAGLVYRVRRWVPRAVFVSPRTALAESRKRELPPEAEPRTITPVGDDRFVGTAPQPGAILLAEPSQPGWEVVADGVELPRRTSFGLVRFPVRDAVDRFVVRYEGQNSRSAAIGLQTGVLLVVISLILRPPGFATRRRGSRPAGVSRTSPVSKPTPGAHVPMAGDSRPAP